MKIDCYISQGCGSETALKENIAHALEAEKIHAEVFTGTKSLIGQIGAMVRQRLAEAHLIRAEHEARKYILREFARTGKPPSGKAVAEAMKLPDRESVHRLKMVHRPDRAPRLYHPRCMRLPVRHRRRNRAGTLAHHRRYTCCLGNDAPSGGSPWRRLFSPATQDD